jgi:hypothetical protein
VGLLDQIKNDVKNITTDLNMFGVALTFVSNDSPPATCTVAGTTTKHRLGTDRDGAPYNGRNASCSVSEQVLTAADYPVRNDKNEVDLKGHRVTFKDSTGNNSTYLIESWYPDEKVGLIVCILGDFE